MYPPEHNAGLAAAPTHITAGRRGRLNFGGDVDCGRALGSRRPYDEMVEIVHDIAEMNEADQGSRAGAVRVRRRKTRHKRLLQFVQHSKALFHLLEPHVLVDSRVTVGPCTVPPSQRSTLPAFGLTSRAARAYGDAGCDAHTRSLGSATEDGRPASSRTTVRLSLGTLGLSLAGTSVG